MEDQNKSEPKQTKPMSERLKGRIVRGLAAVGIAASSSAPIIANAQKDSEAREALSGSAKNTLVTEATLDSSPITQINIPEKSTPAPSNFKSGDPWPIDQFAGVKRAIGLTHPEQIMSDGNSGVLTKETKEKSEVMEINVPAADLLTLPADANKRILDQANYTLPEGEKLSAIPEQGIGFKITTEDEMNQFLRTVQGQNGINNPSILQSLADGWATKVDIDGKHGQGNVYLEIEAINNGITVGIRFEKAIGEFEGSDETVPAGSIWQKGKPILSPREDIKVDPAKQKRGLFAVKVGDYKDNVNNIMKNNPNIKLNLPADNAVMWGDLVEMPQGTGLLALFDDQGRKLVFGTQETVDAHASLQGAATKVPEILPLGKEVPNTKFPEIGNLTKSNGKVTSMEIDGQRVDVVPLPTSHFIVVKENGKAVRKNNPTYGVYEGASADTRIVSFDLIGIVVKTDEVDVQTTDENNNEVTTTSHRVYMIIPWKDGTIRKVRLGASDFINVNTAPKDWENAAQLLKPGYVIDAGIINYDSLDWTDEQLKQGVDAANSKNGTHATYASMKAWIENMKGSVDKIKGIKSANSSEWIDIGGLSGFGISSK